MRWSALALLLTCAAFPGLARADSGRFNLHLDFGGGVPFAGPTRPQASDNERAGGGAAWIGFDWQFSRPWAFEALVGAGGFAKRTPGSDRTGTRFGAFMLGGRLRLMDEQHGYLNDDGGDLPSNLWISAHLGYTRYGTGQFGLDAAIGYEMSVVRPMNIGPFLRTAFAFGDGAHALLIIGVNMSFEVGREAEPTDRDADGLSDEQEASIGTDPRNPDSDGDGLNDGIESRTGTSPMDRDTDGDGLNDGREDLDKDGELGGDETDPRRSDTDGGGVGDLEEVTEIRLDPRDPRDDDSDQDGVANPRDHCPETPRGQAVDENGCPTGGAPTQIQERMVMEGINFASGSARILPSSEETLQRALQLLQREAEVRVEIQGHTDDVGDPRRNQRLSERRAEAVKQWLVSHGIPAARLTTRGLGEAQPIDRNDTDAGRARNRRIEFRRLD